MRTRLEKATFEVQLTQTAKAYMAKGQSRDVRGRNGINAFTFYTRKTRAALLPESRHMAHNGPRGAK